MGLVVRENESMASSVHGVEREEYEIGSGIKQAWVAWTSGVCRVEGRRSKCGSGSSGRGIKRGEPVEWASRRGFEQASGRDVERFERIEWKERDCW